ncbi:uncharacterized protein G2W53_044074 [Senna tora]|uniref:Uncharacterized protein n=1 Tax=Senna tora TaxID=362788 RepID=A0A834W0S3_9FABA|nr:uncharacterized protein G2W53_044074 [Senna tora]
MQKTQLFASLFQQQQSDKGSYIRYKQELECQKTERVAKLDMYLSQQSCLDTEFVISSEFAEIYDNSTKRL